MKNEFSQFVSDQQRKRILKSIIEQFYAEEEFPQPVIFDTHRAWCGQMARIHDLLPQSKVIACVRDTPWIIDSIERLVRKNTLCPSSIFNYDTSGSVYSRADALAAASGLLGFAYNALKEAFYGEHAAKLLVVRYESLTAQPYETLKGIYAFINEADFPHNADNLEFNTKNFDLLSGMPGLHDVRKAVSFQSRRTILPPDIYNRFIHDAFWNKPELNTQHVKIL